MKKKSLLKGKSFSMKSDRNHASRPMQGSGQPTAKLLAVTAQSFSCSLGDAIADLFDMPSQPNPAEK